MDWLRKLENKIENRIEGVTVGRDLHVYEAAHIVCRLLRDNKIRYNGTDLLPNLFIVPFADPMKVPYDYADSLITIVNDYFAQRPFKFLTKFTVRLACRNANFPDVEVGWADELGKIALGFVECIEGSCKGRIWFIPVGGTVI
ncbi:hypothetical protein IJT10_00950, partial [bacterium]|nr:hypothetical protein [bacterium]